MHRLEFSIDGRDWPNRTHSRFVQAAGFTWHVQCFGSGPPLLLLHGTGASTHSWRQIAPLLTPHFSLVIPDLPGHGFTQTPPADAFTLPGMAAAVAALLKELGIEPALVAGHSAGAAVLIRMSLNKLIAPKSIVSVNGALLPFQGLAGQFFSPLAKLLFLNPFVPRFFAWRASDRSAVARLLADTGSAVTSEDVEFYAQLFNSPAHCAAALAMMARWDLSALERDLPKLTPPLLLIAGERDRAIRPSDADRVSMLLRTARVVRIAGAGHLAHEERPAAVADVILDNRDGGSSLP